MSAFSPSPTTSSDRPPANFARAEAAALVLLRSGRRRDAHVAFVELASRWPDVERVATTAAVLTLEETGAVAARPELERVVVRFPSSATAWGALGQAAAATGDRVAAREALTRAVSLDGADARLWFALGRLRFMDGDTVAADEAFAKAVALDDRAAAAMAGRAAAANWLGDWVTGERHARAALAVDPADADAELNLGVACLAQGRWDAGWRHYEARWRTALAAGARHRWPGRRWRGEPGDGATLVVHAEQGFGDTIQFARLAPSARALGFRVVLAVQAPLVRLLDRAALADAVVPFDAAPADAAWHVPLLSLPRFVPPGDGRPYLSCDHAAARPARGPRLGLVWAGSGTHANDARRSIPLEAFAPMLAVPGLTWQSLQHGARAAESGRAPWPITPMPDVADFAETAAIVASCDAVVTVDTAVAHLAAAMGIPTWVLVPAMGRDWRWATATGGRTAWYDAARVVTQRRDGDWATPIAALAAAIGRGIARGGAP